jgi:hypothetical protein
MANVISATSIRRESFRMIASVRFGGDAEQCGRPRSEQVLSADFDDSAWIRSVPPSGSGWVRSRLKIDLELRTHPLPRGGTDFIQVGGA